jgi:hypothetical protein
MKGIELARAFYEEYGKPMIERDFAEYSDRIAVGLVGRGSECYGFDDEISTDHDFEAGFCLWITDEDERSFGFKLFRTYSSLPREYCGIKLKEKSNSPSSGRGIITIKDFYRGYTGKDEGPVTLEDWLYIPSHYLAEATNGEVFYDPLGEFTRIRKNILYGMPEDARLKKIASSVFLMAQSGQYNYTRCLSHGEGGAARLALSEFVKNAIELVFLLNKRHMPYYKWSFRSMAGLEILGGESSVLADILDMPNDRSDVIQRKIEELCSRVVIELKRQKLTDFEDEYLERHAYSINEKISDNRLRNSSIII